MAALDGRPSLQACGMIAENRLESHVSSSEEFGERGSGRILD